MGHAGWLTDQRLDTAQRFGEGEDANATQNVGGAQSLISQPAGMTHASVPPERRAALGLSDGLVRLSCVEVGDEIAHVLDAPHHRRTRPSLSPSAARLSGETAGAWVMPVGQTDQRLTPPTFWVAFASSPSPNRSAASSR